ncbi:MULTISPECIES: arylsulfatase [Henriciella]|uniref:arylsulfatase n=1 Tax=Henriciella TaxID=453849 RepID=UPI003512D25C
MPRHRLRLAILFSVLGACSGEGHGGEFEAPQAPASQTANPDRPTNILLILADDLGFSDLGAYGSEIPTPHLDGLAREGVLFTNFHVSPSCAPTRAMLMTGVSPLDAGMGSVPQLMTPAQQGQRGYEGQLAARVSTMAEHLSAAGYMTFIAGKWHLGATPEALPDQRGFERSFVLVDGAASHFSDGYGYNARKKQATYVENGQPARLPDSFYSSTYYADRVIENLEQAANDGRPFFGYLAFTAPHSPLHAPDDWIARFSGHYDAGFEAIAADRIENARQKGVVPAEAAARPEIKLSSRWNDLSQEQKADMARRMEVYAAMVASMDHEVGRVLERLEALGQLDDTLIIFLSDNGPDPSFQEEAPMNNAWIEQTFDNRLENYGRRGSYISYGLDWSLVSSAPFSLFKGTVGEGGIRVPAIIRFPDGRHAGDLYRDYATALDVLPTILEVSDVSADALIVGKGTIPPQGRSLISALERPGKGASLSTPAAWQSLGTRALQDGRWKARYIQPPLGSGQWTLHDLETDPNEANDVSSEYPDRLQTMIDQWTGIMQERGLVEPPPHFLSMILPSKRSDAEESKPD